MPVPAPAVRDPSLFSLLQAAYGREGKEVYGTGSVADALRWLMAAAETMAAKQAADKAERLLEQLEAWERDLDTATPEDREAANRVRKDLASALADWHKIDVR
jgi:hypothetical protein